MMKAIKTSLLTAMAILSTQVTAFATVNPDTGDHSIVPIAIGGAILAVILLVVIMYFTRDKK